MKIDPGLVYVNSPSNALSTQLIPNYFMFTILSLMLSFLNNSSIPARLK